MNGSQTHKGPISTRAALPPTAAANDARARARCSELLDVFMTSGDPTVRVDVLAALLNEAASGPRPWHALRGVAEALAPLVAIGMEQEE
ncbi:hypothetical protein [Roseateles sp.]|uniref:hypothetical protein n=1 Tax=Roseateles sp. TaxID=1971397 RepID=UPI003265E3E7